MPRILLNTKNPAFSKAKKHGLSLEKPQLTKKTKDVVHAPKSRFSML